MAMRGYRIDLMRVIKIMQFNDRVLNGERINELDITA